MYLIRIIYVSLLILIQIGTEPLRNKRIFTYFCKFTHTYKSDIVVIIYVFHNKIPPFQKLFQ